jgi:hypothetical protein
MALRDINAVLSDHDDALMAIEGVWQWPGKQRGALMFLLWRLEKPLKRPSCWASKGTEATAIL